jgi:hypothetical protein
MEFADALARKRVKDEVVTVTTLLRAYVDLALSSGTNPTRVLAHLNNVKAAVFATVRKG